MYKQTKFAVNKYSSPKYKYKYKYLDLVLELYSSTRSTFYVIYAVYATLK